MYGPGLLQNKGRNQGVQAQEGGDKAELIPEALSIGFEQPQFDNALGGPLDFARRIKSLCVHPPGAEADHAELLVGQLPRGRRVRARAQGIHRRQAEARTEGAACGRQALGFGRVAGS